jgi:hypothetical protein
MNSNGVTFVIYEHVCRYVCAVTAGNRFIPYAFLFAICVCVRACVGGGQIYKHNEGEKPACLLIKLLGRQLYFLRIGLHSFCVARFLEQLTVIHVLALSSSETWHLSQFCRLVKGCMIEFNARRGHICSFAVTRPALRFIHTPRQYLHFPHI